MSRYLFLSEFTIDTDFLEIQKRIVGKRPQVKVELVYTPMGEGYDQINERDLRNYIAEHIENSFKRVKIQQNELE